MAGNMINNPRPQFLDDNGDPYALGTLEFWDADAHATPLDTYFDADLAIGNVNTNPVVLDSAGRPAAGGAEIGIFLKQQAYYVVLKNAAGTEIWNADNVSNITQISISGTPSVDTYAALTVLVKSTLTDGVTYRVLGRTARGDIGAVHFEWSSASAATVNGGTIIAADEGGTGRWLMRYDGGARPEWFNAKGDGSTDDSVAIQAAADASVEVDFNDKTYMAVGFVATQFARWRGAGIGKTIIKQVDGTASMATFLSGSDIEGIEFDGDEQNAVGSGFAVAEFGGTVTMFHKSKITNVSRYGARMRDYTFASFRDSYFAEALAHGGSSGENQLFIYNVGGLTTDKSVFIVDGCYFDDTINATPEEGPAGIFVSQASASARCIITNNHFNNIGTNTAANLSAAIDLYVDGLGSVVSGNIIENYIFEAIKLGGSGEIICTDNHVLSYVDNTQTTAIAVTPHSNTATAHRGRVVVTGNIVTQAATAGIFVSGNVGLGDVFEIIVANNVVSDTGSGDAAIVMARCANWSVIGNVIRNSGLYGISTELSSGACLLANNNISDCADNAIRTEEEDTVASLTCTGNICNENTTGANVIQVNIQNFKHLHFANNTIINTTASQTGVNIAGISERLFIGDNLIDLNSGTEWAVNITALASTADFWTVASYPYTHTTDPGGAITAGYAGQTIKATDTGRIYLARTAGGTVWDIV